MTTPVAFTTSERARPAPPATTSSAPSTSSTIGAPSVRAFDPVHDPVDAQIQAERPRFADRTGWTTQVTHPTQGSFKIAGGKSFCESKLTVSASPAEVAARLADPASWNRWYGSFHMGERTQVVFDPKRSVDGTIKYTLMPTGAIGPDQAMIGLRIREEMHPPRRLPDGGYVIPIQLRGGAEGLAYFELRPAPGGGTEILGRFNGVAPGRWLPFSPERFTQNHLLVEAGRASEIPLVGLTVGTGGGLPELARSNGWKIRSP
jgi:hypothetical protein